MASSEKNNTSSHTEDITQRPMTKPELVKAVADLYNIYANYEMAQQKFGISKKMVVTYIRLARLPDQLKKAIEEGDIHTDLDVAELVLLKAVDALNYTKNGPTPIEDVIKLAKVLAGQNKSNINYIAKEISNGKTLHEAIVSNYKKKEKEKKIIIHLSSESNEKLVMVSESNGEDPTARATQYVVDCTDKDYNQM